MVRRIEQELLQEFDLPMEVLVEERLLDLHLLAHIYPKEQMIKQVLHLRFVLPKEELEVEQLLDLHLLVRIYPMELTLMIID